MPKIYVDSYSTDYDKERCIILGRFIIETNGTVRDAATHFGVSKSTVHKDITEKLKKANKGLYTEVKKILAKNKAERHIRGGMATKKKYISIKEKLLVK